MSKYKVLHIFSSFTIGGAEKMTVAVAYNLSRFSSEFESLVAAPKGSYIYEQSLKNGVKVYDFTCRGSFTPTGVLKLFNIIRKEKINIVHVHQGKLYWTALFMKLFFHKLKVVLHRRQDTRHKFYTAGHYKMADMTVTVSKTVRDNLVRFEKAPEEKTKVLYNGFDFETFAKDIDCTDIKQKYNLENKIVVGCVGAMVSLEGKGQIYLMDAMAELKKKYNDRIVCLFVGDGPGRRQQEEYAQKSGISDIVFFTGQQSNVAKYINSMDIFCLVSCDTEGFGNVNIEAQYLAKPVITTNIGGIPETVIKDKTAIVIEPRNSKQIADAIEKLAENKELRTEMGNSGKEFVKNTFSSETMVQNLVSVYKSILKA